MRQRALEAEGMQLGKNQFPQRLIHCFSFVVHKTYEIREPRPELKGYAFGVDQALALAADGLDFLATGVGFSLKDWSNFAYASGFFC